MARVGPTRPLLLMLFARSGIRAVESLLSRAELMLNNGEWQTAWFMLLEAASIIQGVGDLVPACDGVALEALRMSREVADRLAARIAFGEIAYPEVMQSYHEERNT